MLSTLPDGGLAGLRLEGVERRCMKVGGTARREAVARVPSAWVDMDTLLVRQTKPVRAYRGKQAVHQVTNLDRLLGLSERLCGSNHTLSCPRRRSQKQPASTRP